MSTKLDPEEIAKVAHEANRAYCKALGDDSQPNWELAPDWQKDSARKGVAYHTGNPNSTPADSHTEWMNEKVRTGWKWGFIKDPIRQEHPLMVPFDQLSNTQKAKDYIFHSIVKSLSAISLNVYFPDISATNVQEEIIRRDLDSARHTAKFLAEGDAFVKGDE